MSLFEPMIGLTGEIELEKGGPGSGPRPGSGSVTPPAKRGSAFQRRALKEGNAVMHHGEFKRVVGTSRDGKTVDLQDKNGNTQTGVDSNFTTPIKFSGAGLKDYGNNHLRKSISLTGEIELEKGGPGSGPRPGNGSNKLLSAKGKAISMGDRVQRSGTGDKIVGRAVYTDPKSGYVTYSAGNGDEPEVEHASNLMHADGIS